MNPNSDIDYRRNAVKRIETEFSFLHKFGYELVRSDIDNDNNFKSGFRLEYKNKEKGVKITYGDSEFNIYFFYGSVERSYLTIDYYLFNNASSLSGNMFRIEKLESIILSIAQDIKNNYSSILSGELAIWEKVEKIPLSPVKEKKLP